MKFSAIFKPTNLFSLKDSNFTNSGAKSLLLPSPYSVKMAIFNQAITELGTEIFNNKKSKELSFIKDTTIEFYIQGSFCVNNCFVKILKQKDDKRNKKQREQGVVFESGFTKTISFREYIYISDDIELIFSNENSDAETFLKKYIHKINYFGKRGSFFQFFNYDENPNKPNVKVFNAKDFTAGIIQEFDDIDDKANFENINNFAPANAKRKKDIMVIPLSLQNSSKSYSNYVAV